MIGEKLGPYEILASLGAGGMGEVWKARDTRLDRIVAIKKVKEKHSDRFRQEARSIAALNHPYICQIHDIGPDYLVLEYIEGKSLSCPLPEKEAVRLAIQITEALEEAHQRGIIHRDLKPSNIMVTEKGSVKLLDFGLAKLYEEDGALSDLTTFDAPATQAGAVLGTVAYMSPEQAQGQPADVRSDIFSFGLVLYEMLSGKRAFSGTSSLVVAAALMKDNPPPIQASQPLEDILQRCLEKQPSGRYQTILEVKTALQQTLKGASSEKAVEPQPSIAVLPFANMSGDKEQEYFSDGLAEEIINALTKIPELKVIARTSSFAFRGKEQDITKIAEALRVNTILEGSVRKAGNRIRVTAQLITASDGSHLWSERYDREMTDVFAIQDEICQAIVDKLRVKLETARPAVKRYAENLEAYSLYLKGRYHLSKYTEDSLAKGKQCYEQAILLDDNYALAWYGLARFYYLMGHFGFMSPKTANAEASRAALRVLELDELLPEAHSMTAILRASEFSWKGSEIAFRRAMELSPESSDVWHTFSYYYLVPKGYLDEAIDASRKALELDPLSPLLQFHLGLRYFSARQYDKAIEQLSNALDLDPQYYWAHMMLGVSHILTGNLNEGIRSCEAADRCGGHMPAILGFLGWAYAMGQQINEAKKLLSELQDISLRKYISASSVALLYVGLGERDSALEWYEKAIDEHEGMILGMHSYPTIDTIRSDPRFKTLLHKMNL